MSIKPTGNDPTRSVTPPANDGNRSAKERADRLNEGIAVRDKFALGTAPQDVQAMVKGDLPKTAAQFRTCVVWLAQHGEQQGLLQLFTAPKCSDFDKLDLHGQPISADALKLLALYLDRSSVTVLNLSGCGLGNDHADAIGMLLAPGSKLTTLDVSHNKLDGAFFKLCTSLKVNQTLKHLNAAHCGVDAGSFAALLGVLSQTPAGSSRTHVPANNATLESLCLSDNEIFIPEELDGDYLSGSRPEYQAFELLGDMPSIKWLDLSNTGILRKPEALRFLFMNFNPALARVDLGNNEYVGLAVPTSFNPVCLKFVTHLGLANVRPAQAAAALDTRFSPIDVLRVPTLKVVDLRGVRSVFVHPLCQGDQDRRLSGYLSANRSLICVKIDPDHAAAARARGINSRTFGFGEAIVGVAGAFLVTLLNGRVDQDTAQGMTGFSSALDMRSAVTLKRVNKATANSKPEFDAALHERSGDPGFDWSLECRVADDLAEAADDGNSSNTNALITTADPTATTTTTTTTTDLTALTTTMTTTTTTDRTAPSTMTTTTATTENNDGNSSSSSSNSGGN